MRVEVLRLGPDDWARFRAVRQASLRTDPAAFAASAHRWVDEHDQEPRWRARLHDAETFVAAVDGLDVGTAGLSSDGELLGMWVDPGVRGRGVGRALVAAVRDAAGGSGTTLRVMADNGPAVRFYEGSGFVLTSTDPDAEGCLTMVARVSG